MSGWSGTTRSIRRTAPESTRFLSTEEVVQALWWRWRGGVVRGGFTAYLLPLVLRRKSVG